VIKVTNWSGVQTYFFEIHPKVTAENIYILTIVSLTQSSEQRITETPNSIPGEGYYIYTCGLCKMQPC